MNQVEITEYILPDGRRKLRLLEVSDETKAICDKLQGAGYRFECEILSDGAVSMTVTDDDADYDMEIMSNTRQSFTEKFSKMVSRFVETI